MDTKSSNNEIWVETIANITKYVKERQSFYFNIISQNNTEIEIEVGDNLIDEIYDYPLTAHITVPPDWDFVLLEQGSRTDVLESFIMDTSTVVMGKVIPDGGNVKISKFIPNSVTENEYTQPEDFVLFQNYPNPFNPSTRIKFSIPQDERRETEEVSLKVYDVLGNKVATLVDEEKPQGEYSVRFDASSLPSGMYVYTLQSGSNFASKKMMLLK